MGRMKLRSDVAALIGGVAGSLVTLGALLVYKKFAELDPLVANVEAAASGTASGRSVMAAKAREVVANLDALGNQYTEALAKETAERYIADVYGLTPERIAGIDRLSRVLG